MNTHQTRGRRLGRGLLRGFLALLLCTAAGCFSLRFGGYPSMLGSSEGNNVVIWPANAEGSLFHTFGTPVDESLGDEPGVVDFPWPAALPAVFSDPVGSVTVLLDPKPTVELRARVSELLAQVERAHPAVSTSVTVCLETIGPITSSEDFTLAIQRLFEARMQAQHETDAALIVEFEDLNWIMESKSLAAAVLPNASAPGQYFVVESPTFPMPEDWLGSIPSHTHNSLVSRFDSMHHVTFLVPHGTPPEVVSDMEALRQEFLSPASGEPGKSPPLIAWPLLYGELRDAKAVRLILQGRLADCACSTPATP